MMPTSSEFERAPAIFLEGERLYLRPLEYSDLERCTRWINDPETRRFLLSVVPFPQHAERAWMDSHPSGMVRSDIHLAIVLKDGDRHIGNTGMHGLDWLNRRGVTGTLIGEKDVWGQGFGTEAKAVVLSYAFDTLGLHRVESAVFEFNERSARHLKANGYIEEGRRRKAIWRDGAWWDELMFGVFREEYLASPAGQRYAAWRAGR